ncbi:sugar ABC transporter substrate-binding protein [Coralloluteibacterium stylophorae]|uniref:Sugar ABC transporter substrate-binding protein n=1 Tax=Coralloluteibacterium stylophorae TaxID=1776034 RepID=A0A8J7VUU5_9GAMM|nr:sugar ABC transporter substrate-binding protein [Coralloluteibacterium stylophorae]MBS7456158.1 sugar ABC transporter substrate-binding protein [Coralloluteibacterium stylophorae]
MAARTITPRRPALTNRARAGLSLALACATLAGCGRGDADVVTLDFWVMGREGEVVAQLIPDFEARHPGIRVELQQLPVKSAHEKLMTSFAADALPDIVPLGNTWVPEFDALGALEPLDARVAASATVDAGDYFPAIWDTNVIHGRTLGVPWYVDTRLFFYRRDLLTEAGFDHPPTTWDEWMTQMRAIKAQVGPDRFAALLPLNEFEQLLAFGLQADEPLLRDDGRYGNFSSQGFRDALALYASIFEERLAPVAANTQISNVWNEFGNGYYSFYVSGPWNIAEFQQRLPDSQQDDWATAPLPGKDGPGLSSAGGSSLVIFRSSEHKDAAWALIEYLSEPAVQQRFHALTGDLPPRRSTWEFPSLADDPHAAAFREQLERVESTPKVAEWERIVTEMQRIAERVVAGQYTVEEGAAEIDRRVDGILAKRRWVLDQEAQRAQEGDAA